MALGRTVDAYKYSDTIFLVNNRLEERASYNW